MKRHVSQRKNRKWQGGLLLALALLAYSSVGFGIIVDDGSGGTTDPTNGNTAPITPIPTFTRTGNSIKVTIKDSSLYEQGYTIQKRGAYGIWSTIASIGPLVSGASYSRTDYGLSPESYYCYRTQAFNEHGTRNSSTYCAYTTDGNDHQVWRVQVELTTSNIANANTNDSIWVRLNSSSNFIAPHGNMTWMDYSINDFERGQVHKYDLNVDGISDMSDIDRIYFGKTGSDGWCVESVKLIVNEIEVFDKSYTNETSGCHWMDNDTGHSNYLYIGRSELRGHSSWNTYNELQALAFLAWIGITEDALEERIEGMVGHIMHGEPLYWGYIYGEAVSVMAACPSNTPECSKVHIDLDMGAQPSILGISLPNLSVDVDFDLNFQCNNGALNIWTSNFTTNAQYSWLVNILTFGLLGVVESEVENAVRYGWKAIAQNVSGLPECRVYADTNNTIHLEAVED